jgi:hypothetical protein
MRSLIVTTALCLSGCLWDEPLLPGPARGEARLVGTWKCMGPETEELLTLKVTEPSPRQYRAEFDGGEDEPLVQLASIVRFQGQELLNVQDEESGKWTVARHTLYRPELLHLEMLQDAAFQDAEDSAARLAILKKGLKDGKAFEDYCTCIRVKEE